MIKKDTQTERSENMKILLAACNAKYIHSNLAVYNLRACVRNTGPEILLREYTINQSKDEILRDLYQNAPDLLCFSCYIWNISFVRDLMEDFSKICPEVPIWVGGPEVSYDAEQFLGDNPWVAGVMRGEGEQTFKELVLFYDGRSDNGLEDIQGITWCDHQREIWSTQDRPVMNLDEVPFAYEDLADFEHRIIYYESSRGCPFSCSYCLSSIDKKLRFRSLDLVKKELQFFLDHRVPQVKFVDRTFNCRHEHAMEIWRYLLEHDNGGTNFHFEIEADVLTKEELDLMRQMRPGLIQLEIGVQSTNVKTLQEIRRHVDFDRISRTVKRIQDMRNIHQHLDLIAGLPFEDLDSFRKSFEDVYALRPEQLQLGFLKVLKGSYMCEKTKEYGCVYKSKEPYEVLSTRWLAYGDILRLKKVETMVEVYYNSGQFTNTLPELEQYFANAFDFYESLGDFYEQKGYDTISHSRLRRYEILLEFMESVVCGDSGILKKKMLFDLYLRENMKNRPKWARDLKPYEREIWAYRKANQVPKTAHLEVEEDGSGYLFDYERRDPLTHNAKMTKVRVWP